jgi:hypothetical protein
MSKMQLVIKKVETRTTADNRVFFEFKGTLVGRDQSFVLDMSGEVEAALAQSVKDLSADNLYPMISIDEEDWSLAAVTEKVGNNRVATKYGPYPLYALRPKDEADGTPWLPAGTTKRPITKAGMTIDQMKALFDKARVVTRPELAKETDSAV